MGLSERWAGVFGRIEHEAGRWILVPIVATLVLLYLKIYDYAFYTAILVLVVWAIYLVSHTIEKKFYGPGLRR